MDDGDRQRAPAAPWPDHWIWIGVAVSASVLAFWAIASDRTLLDWDTYRRVRLIDEFRLELQVDGHILYHAVLKLLRWLGLSPLHGVALITSLSVGALVAVLGLIARYHRLPAARTALVLLAATICAPGFVELVLSGEDNVSYLPPVALFVHLISCASTGRSTDLRLGVLAGLSLAVAMLLNITALIFLFAAVVIPVTLLLGQPRPALRLAASLAVGLGGYYLAHLTIFRSAQIALHEFLPQAIHLRDFALSTAPLLSFARLTQYVGGLRAMLWAPTAHRMAIPGSTLGQLFGIAPWALAASHTLFLGSALERRARQTPPLGVVALHRLDVIALVGLCLAFPFFYEPYLIERWDMLWVSALVALVALLRHPLRGFRRLCVGAILCLQLLGSAVVITSHFTEVWAHGDLLAARALAQRLRGGRIAAAILDERTDRHLLAYIGHQSRTRLFFIAEAGGDPLRFMRVVGTVETPVAQAVVRQELGGVSTIFLGPRVDHRVAAALDLAPGAIRR